MKRTPAALIAATALLAPLAAPVSGASATPVRAQSRVVAAASAHQVAASKTKPPTARHRPDFDGDGYADLVVPVPNDDVGAGEHAGSIWIAYGGVNGVNSRNRHSYFTESSIAHGATSATGDSFGWVTAWGDFNHDGYDDLAIGAPNATVNGQHSAGELVVLYGSAHGLETSHAQVFTEATPGLASTPALNDYFGLGVAAGDFNHDGYTDIAVDAGGVGVHGITRSGRVTELFGSSHGLLHSAPLTPRQFDESTAGVHGGIYQNDDWGRTLASGDFNGDGYADLAVGAPKKAAGLSSGAGVVDVLYGGPDGLTGSGAQTWTEDTSGMPTTSHAADAFGWSLAAGDFNGDGRSDLAIGVPTKTDAVSSAGAAILLYGSAHGLTTQGVGLYTLPSVTNQAEVAGDQFALSIATLDYDGDGRTDLAFGVPGRDVNGHANAGEIVLLHNVGGKLVAPGIAITRDSAGMIGPSAPNEHFGLVLTPGDFDGNGTADLAVSVPGMTVDTQDRAGAVQVFSGTAGGLDTNDVLLDAPSPFGGTAVEDATLGGVNNPAGA